MKSFSVEIELANDADLIRAKLGRIPASDVRRLIVQGEVRSRGMRLVIPETVADRLGLELEGKTQVRYAEGRTAQRDIARRVHLTYGGRDSIFNAIVEPDRESALIGAIVLEDLDFIIDCANQRLVPRDPNQIISEVESFDDFAAFGQAPNQSAIGTVNQLSTRARE